MGTSEREGERERERERGTWNFLEMKNNDTCRFLLFSIFSENAKRFLYLSFPEGLELFGKAAIALEIKDLKVWVRNGVGYVGPIPFLTEFEASINKV